MALVAPREHRPDLEGIVVRRMSEEDRAVYLTRSGRRRRDFLEGRALLQLLLRSEEPSYDSFSISHCPTHVAVVGSKGGVNGIDVESAPRYIARAAERRLGAEVARALDLVDRELRDSEFRRMWTLAEAAFKCRASDLVTARHCPLPSEGRVAGWTWRLIEPWPGVSFAHVADGGALRVHRLARGWMAA